MNFFEHQHLARRNSRRLVLLFALAVLAIIVVTNLLLALVWRMSVGMGGLPGYFYVVNTFVILLFVLGGAWFETWNLREGGDAVARMVGGRLATGNPRDALDKRLTNIVEEMALAAGIAVPKVYVLDDEEGINAFAAGTGPNDSVVAVTRGTLTRLSRDELQGVVAHEFSHILNGDVQLNLRLTGLVYGLTLISHLGELVLRGSRGTLRVSRNSNSGGASAAFLAVGLVLLVMGWIGTLFGRMIKAGVSREREFLADASAVQFTRNQEGIGGALRKIAGLSVAGDVGSHIDSVHAETLSHMFMAGARGKFLSGLFATHPPLPDRIKRIYGGAREALTSTPAAIEVESAAPLPPLAFSPVDIGTIAALSVDAAASSSNAPPAPGAAEQAQRALLDACQDAFGAQAVVLAWLLAEEPQVRALQFAALPAGITQREVDALAPHTHLAGQPFRLKTIHAATPHLKLLSASQRHDFLSSVRAFVAADNRVLPFEFALQTLIEARLAPPRVLPVVYRDVDELRTHVRTTFGVFAQLAQSNESRVREDARQAGIALSGQALPQRAALDADGIRNALNEIAKLAPLAKPKLIKAWAAMRDESPVADELAQAMAAAIDCPWPYVTDVVASTH
jgi:Zn-dependent protease with chaperone function